TSTAPSNFTATGSNSSSSNSSQSKRASGAHSQQTPTPPVSRVPDDAFVPRGVDLPAVVQGEDIDSEAWKAPLPASLVGSAARAQPLAHAGTFIDTRPSTAQSDYEADDDEEGKRERPPSWLAEVRGWEDRAGYGGDGRAEVSGPVLRLDEHDRRRVQHERVHEENTFGEERASGEVFGKVPFPRSRSRPRELGFASAGYAMKMGNRGRTLSSISRVGPEMFERDARLRDSIDSMDSVDSTASSNGGAMDLEELSTMTAHVFS
ncbi:hypothetical protein FS837_005789, partial [Tulasnella sp. UAMH 9824]